MIQQNKRFTLSINFGFTLVEMSIVLVIVGLILGGVLNARSIIRNAQTQDRIKAIKDFTVAAHQFKERYGMWPGDYSNAVANIAGLTCANGDGLGQVNTVAETACATQSLIRVGTLRGDVANPITIGQSTYSITSPALSGVAALPASWVNVVHIQNLDCDSAVQMDRAVDDGNVDTGNFRVTAGGCGAAGNNQDENVVIANAAYRVN